MVCGLFIFLGLRFFQFRFLSGSRLGRRQKGRLQSFGPMVNVVVSHLDFPEEAISQSDLSLIEHGVQSVSRMDAIENEVVKADARVGRNPIIRKFKLFQSFDLGLEVIHLDLGF